MENKFTSYFIILLLCVSYSNSFYHSITKDEPFFLRFENEKDKQEDPLEFAEDYFRDSFRHFISSLTEKDNLDLSYCYQQLYGESVRVSKEFLARFNSFVESAENFKEKNKYSLDIKIDSECFYNEKSYNTALDKKMDFSRKSLEHLKDALMFFVRSDFFENFQRFTKCAVNEKELLNYSKFRLLEKNNKIEEIFNSLCSAQNLVYLFNKKVDKKTNKILNFKKI
jgi:hypothetical protein